MGHVEVPSALSGTARSVVAIDLDSAGIGIASKIYPPVSRGCVPLRAPGHSATPWRKGLRAHPSRTCGWCRSNCVGNPVRFPVRYLWNQTRRRALAGAQLIDAARQGNVVKLEVSAGHHEFLKRRPRQQAPRWTP